MPHSVKCRLEVYEYINVHSESAKQKLQQKTFNCFYFYLSKKKGLIFHVNPLPSRGFT